MKIHLTFNPVKSCNADPPCFRRLVVSLCLCFFRDSPFCRNFQTITYREIHKEEIQLSPPTVVSPHQNTMQQNHKTCGVWVRDMTLALSWVENLFRLLLCCSLYHSLEPHVPNQTHSDRLCRVTENKCRKSLLSEEKVHDTDWGKLGKRKKVKSRASWWNNFWIFWYITLKKLQWQTFSLNEHGFNQNGKRLALWSLKNRRWTLELVPTYPLYYTQYITLSPVHFHHLHEWRARVHLS